jgi:hypothetical protein
VGDQAAEKMLHAMGTAKYGVVILSPGFFLRKWCMKELQTFANRGRMVPIFLPAKSSAGGGAGSGNRPAFEAVTIAKMRAVADRVWSGFKQYVQTEEEYLEAVNAALPVGLRLDAFDGF